MNTLLLRHVEAPPAQLGSNLGGGARVKQLGVPHVAVDRNDSPATRVGGDCNAPPGGQPLGVA